MIKVEVIDNDENKVCPLMSYRFSSGGHIHCCRNECELWNNTRLHCSLRGGK